MGPAPGLQESLEEQLELLHAWHAWLLNELSHFKSKFRGSGGTLLGAADHQNFSAGTHTGCSAAPGGAGTRRAGCAAGLMPRPALGAVAGVENFFYEGPLRLRMPVSMELDSDGAFSFDLPLPSPIGDFGKVPGAHASSLHQACFAGMLGTALTCLLAGLAAVCRWLQVPGGASPPAAAGAVDQLGAQPG